MNRAKNLILTVEYLISTKSKQHIVGGILFSVSVFLGALATTVLTMKVNTSDDEQNNNCQDEYEEDIYDY